MKMNKEIVMVRLSDIIPNRFQPRLSFDEEALNELAESIKEHGIIQPLILRDLGNKYEIIAGERRFKASQLAGVLEVPAVIGQMDDQTSAELALIENIQRKDLSAIEEAKSYKKILDMGGFTQEELAKRMGKGQSTIANKMRLLSLTNEVQAALMNNLISERHARCLLQLKDENKQKEVLNKVITERMNVRDTDNYIKSILGESREESISNEINTQNHLPISMPEIEPLEKETNEQFTQKQNKSENPNVYTQTNNIDFIDLNNLNSSESDIINTVPEVKDEPVEEILPDISIEDERKEEIMQNDLNVENRVNNKQDNMSKLKMATAIRLAQDALEDIKTAGYQASLEEKDDVNSYQIIINIQK